MKLHLNLSVEILVVTVVLAIELIVVIILLYFISISLSFLSSSLLDSNIDTWAIVSSKLLSDEQQMLDDDVKNHLRNPMIHDFKVMLLKEIDDTKWMFNK